MLVNCLPLIVVFGMELPVRAGERLRGFIGLKAQVEFLFPISILFPPQTLIAQHEVVMCLKIFRIDG